MAGLTVEDLRVDASEADVDIVSGISFTVEPGSALGLVGESGCGKTTVAMALLGFARPGTKIVSGHVRVGGADILTLDEGGLRAIRGRSISYVPQNPARALSPGMRVGEQVGEMVDVHLGPRAAGTPLEDAWAAAQLPTTDDFGRRFPHQLSGGQQQRVAIAMALVCKPSVIVMDEPTTGLDVLTQERLLRVIREIRTQHESCIVYISHDLGVVRNLVDHVAVMYGGRIVEHAPVDELFRAPRHPYTRRLLEAIPRVHRSTGTVRGIAGRAVEPWNRPAGCPFAPRCDYRIEQCDQEMPPQLGDTRHSARCWRVDELPAPDATPAPVAEKAAVAVSPAPESEPLLNVRDLVAGYKVSGGLFGRSRVGKIAVDRVSFELLQGSCLAVVGESGSGKTTLARCLAGLHDPFAGELVYQGRTLPGLARRRDPDLRRRIQIVFQDPDSSLNPSMTVGAIVGRPLVHFFGLGHTEVGRRVHELLERVHLPASMAARLPRDLSGGEKQRVAIARAIAAEPELLVCDEVASALDVAVQASILELLDELRESTRMSMLFVTHDLAVVRAVADFVLVMSDGVVRELADRETVFSTPRDEYTKRLLAAAPDLNDGDYPRWADRLDQQLAKEAS
jgi:oligopeptide/dipeptide ABC transporter ATP-binding protein